MRVTNEALLQQFLRGLSASRESSESSLRQLTDGKRVRVASDDPTAARASLELRARLARLDGYERTAPDASFRLGTIEASLGRVGTILSKARELALQAGSSVYEDQADNLAIDVEELRRDVLEIANLQRNGRYVFAGTAVGTEPFDPSGAYLGNANRSEAPIDDSRTVGTTIPGDHPFHGGGDVFATLDSLATAIRDLDTAGIEAAAAELSDEIDHVNLVRAEVGLQISTIDSVLGRHGDEKVQLQGRISELEDVRFEEVITRLAGSENAYEALSSAAANVLNRSLFDFLR